MTAAHPSPIDVHGFQPRWMAARPGSRLERWSSPARAGAYGAGRPEPAAAAMVA